MSNPKELPSDKDALRKRIIAADIAGFTSGDKTESDRLRKAYIQPDATASGNVDKKDDTTAPKTDKTPTPDTDKNSLREGGYGIEPRRQTPFKGIPEELAFSRRIADRSDTTPKKSWAERAEEETVRLDRIRMQNYKDDLERQRQDSEQAKRDEARKAEQSRVRRQKILGELEIFNDLGILRTIREIKEDAWKGEGILRSGEKTVSPDNAGGKIHAGLDFTIEVMDKYWSKKILPKKGTPHTRTYWVNSNEASYERTISCNCREHSAPLGYKFTGCSWRNVGESRSIGLNYESGTDIHTLSYLRSATKSPTESASLIIGGSMSDIKKTLDAWYLDIALVGKRIEEYKKSAGSHYQFVRGHTGKIFTSEDDIRMHISDETHPLPQAILGPLR